jgi:RimJ/RimL family protein N-acetyltransferase
MLHGVENAFGQPVGPPVPGWTPRPRPAPGLVLEGRACRLEALDADRHAADLQAAYATAPDDRQWTYMPHGPFADGDAYRAWVEAAAPLPDPFFLAVVDRATGRATGVASYLRITPEHGTIEVGWISFSPLLQRTVAATEAMALMMRHAFDDLGYRRYEWKCDALNAPSRRAAERLGFRFEGVHRQAIVVKGRNRDTAWFSILDSEWPAVRGALATWLAPENFDADGRQRSPLAVARP